MSLPVGGNAGGVFDLSRIDPLIAPFRDERAVRVEHLNEVVAVPQDIDVSQAVKGEPLWEVVVGVVGAVPSAEELAICSELLNPIIVCVRDIEPILSINGDGAWPGKLARVGAAAAKARDVLPVGVEHLYAAVAVINGHRACPRCRWPR